MFNTKTLAAMLLAGLSGWSAADETTIPPAAAETPLAVKLHTVERQRMSVNIAVAGTIIARKSVRLTAQIPGRIESLSGKEGDHFRYGSELARIDDSALRARLDSAQAARTAAVSSRRNAEVQYNRELSSPQSGSSTAPGGMGMPSMMDQMFTNPMQNMMGMRSRGNERASDLVARETQIHQADTQIRQADAQIREIQSSLRDARSLAPFDGVIEQLHVEIGDTVQPGQPILDFSETAGYQVQTDIPVRLRPGLQEGQSLMVQLEGRELPARISRIFPVADLQQHTVRVELDLPPGTNATVGQYAEVAVPDMNSTQNAVLTIPQSAIRTQGGMDMVLSVADDGRTRLRIVRLGEAVGTGQIAVLSGIAEKDQIVADLKANPGLRGGRLVEPAQ